MCSSFFLSACSDSKKNTPFKDTKTIKKIDGEALAKTHCARCHEFPEPHVLPKAYWEEVLPVMGLYLHKQEKLISANLNNPIAKKRLTEARIYPETQILNDEEWKAITNYYSKNSPEHTMPELLPKFEIGIPHFETKILPWKHTGDGLTYLNFKNGNYQLGYNSEQTSHYIVTDTTGQEIQNFQIPYPLVKSITKGKIELLLLMGPLASVDDPKGQILIKKDTLYDFISALERPADFVIKDFNNDGSDDLLVAEFGKNLGGINIYTTRGENSKNNVHSKPGAVKFELRDVNNDGLEDFYVLISQEDESIYLFLNEGDFKFTKKKLLSLPPYYGTTHFELLDFDKDGDEDIICSSGDNGDFTSVVKPFHGIRLFENLGKNQYKQAWFHKQVGAYGTACADYDNDGDIDIASIGYYASLYNANQESFLYFENQGQNTTEKWNFKTHTLPNVKNSCFMLITSADIDNDGDLDILLGSNSYIYTSDKKQAISKKWQEQGGLVTILKNTHK
ncbi:FG-GAP repeat domain-containing protein [Flavicella sediminum]|uniref:FG-GAP repeat domain-containing protein n=1 Tax=Flavicella sediminum TaxID=2585141 RepID=UPI0011212842|nr:VCBS repeat-containing protein [Flavicella sediminum]